MLETDGRVRIVDFGLARLAGSESLTTSGDVVGTLDYMAPEVIEGPRAASPSSDLYSVGVMLYELATLSRPFGKARTEVKVARALAGDPVPAHKRARVPRELSAILEQAMRRDASRRYADAAEFHTDLQAYLNGREVLARPSTALERLGRRIQRHLVLSSILALLFATAVALAFVWKNATEVQARVAHNDALNMFTESFFLEYRDLDHAPMRPNTTEFREQAIDMLAEAAGKAPQLAEIRLHQAVLLSEIGRKNEAREVLRTLVDFDRAPHTISWVRSNIAAPDLRVVGPLSKEDLPLTDTSPIDRFYFARSLISSRRSDEAPEITRSLALHPLYGAQSMFLEGISHMTGAVRDPVYAVGLYRGAIGLVGDNPVIFSNLGVALMDASEKADDPEDKTTHLEEAIVWLEKAGRATPDSERVWNSHAEALMRLGRFQQAGEIALRGLQFTGDSFLLEGAVAESLLQGMGPFLSTGEPVPKTRIAAIEEPLLRAIQLEPKYPANVLRMATLHYYTEEDEEAHRWAKQAIELGIEGSGLRNARTILEATAPDQD